MRCTVNYARDEGTVPDCFFKILNTTGTINAVRIISGIIYAPLYITE